MLMISSKGMLPLCLMCLTSLVAGRLLEGADEERRGAGNNAHRCLTILNRQLDGDAESFPILGRFGDIITNFFWRKTQGSDFGGERGSSTNFTSDGPQTHNLNFSGIEFGRHFVFYS